MALWTDGKVVRTLLLDKYFVDYLWYRTCEINSYSVCVIPAAENIENELSRASLDPNAQRFMSDNDVRDNSTLNLDRFIKVLHNEYTQACISKDDLHWIDEKNTRLIFYIWRTLSHLTLDHISNKMFDFDLKCEFLQTMQPNNCKKIVRMNDITNVKISTFLIVCCINRLRVSKAIKLQILDNIKETASYSLKNQEITRWLNKDENQKISWTFDYLLNIKLRYIPLVLPGSMGVRDDIISFFDVTRTFNEDSSKLIILTMKKSWSQRKYRDKNKDKKQYSINMSQDIGDILDELSQVENKNKNAIIEELIREAYAKRCSI